jgi:hypothetical protein
MEAMIQPAVLSDSAVFAQEPASDRLVVFCSGRLMGFKRDDFSFLRRSGALAVNRLFIRDNFGLWYQAGLKGLSRDVTSTADWLAGFAAKGGFARVSMVGISSGGYAALILGALIGAHTVHALSPRTLLHEDAEIHADRDRHGVQKSLAALQTLPVRQEQFFDLRCYFTQHPLAARLCQIHFDPTHSLDAFHAERLADLPGFEFRRYPDAGHWLGKLVNADRAFRESLTG